VFVCRERYVAANPATTGGLWSRGSPSCSGRLPSISSLGRCEKAGTAVAVLTYVLGNLCHHGVVATAEALESYEWTAYGELLGRREPRVGASSGDS
jgi:hypothetical protein